MLPVVKSIRIKKHRSYRTPVHEVSACVEHENRIFDISYCYSTFLENEAMDIFRGTGLYVSVVQMRTSMNYMIQPLYENFIPGASEHGSLFGNQATKVGVSVSGGTYLVYPRYAAYVRPIRRHLRATEKLSLKFDYFLRIYGEATVANLFSDVMKQGVEFTLRDMKARGTCAKSDIPGVMFRV